MTLKQYERWQAFSFAMARAYPNATEARRERLVEETQSWFDEIGGYGNAYWQGMESWDHGASYACDWVSETFNHYRHERGSHRRRDYEVHGKFYDQLCCCLRAGMDLAAQPSAGVFGFTVGDLRAMFDGRIPLWISRKFKGGLSRAKANEGVWL